MRVKVCTGETSGLVTRAVGRGESFPLKFSLGKKDGGGKQWSLEKLTMKLEKAPFFFLLLLFGSGDGKRVTRLSLCTISSF